MSEMDWLEPVMKAADAANPLQDGDYLDEEGFICCGKCHTRRQTEIEIPATMGGKRKTKVWVNCKCKQEEMDQRKKLEDERREMMFIESLRSESLMDERLAGATFDSSEITSKNAKNMKLCRAYVKRFDEMMAKNQGLLFYGGVGTGKTHAAACIANALLEKRVPVVMTSFVKLLDAMQGFAEKDEQMIMRLNRPKLLIIDDLGTERNSDYALEKVYNIIDSRYRAKKPVILTTNISMEEMKDTSDRRYMRIYDRIFEMCFPMQFVGGSWRRKEANRRWNDMKSLMEEDD